MRKFRLHYLTLPSHKTIALPSSVSIYRQGYLEVASRNGYFVRQSVFVLASTERIGFLLLDCFPSQSRASHASFCVVILSTSRTVVPLLSHLYSVATASWLSKRSLISSTFTMNLISPNEVLPAGSLRIYATRYWNTFITRCYALSIISAVPLKSRVSLNGN